MDENEVQVFNFETLEIIDPKLVQAGIMELYQEHKQSLIRSYSNKTGNHSRSRMSLVSSIIKSEAGQAELLKGLDMSRSGSGVATVF